MKVPIDSPLQFFRGPLPGCRCLFLAYAGVGEGSAQLQGVQPGLPALLAHAKGHQRAGSCLPVEAFQHLDIGLGMGCGDDFYHFTAEAAGAVQDGQQYLLRRGAFKVMVGTDEDGSAGAAGLPDAPSHGGGRLHFQVHVLGAGQDGPLQDGRCLGFLFQPAGGDEGHVALAEQKVDVFLFQSTAVQADFGHLQLLQQRLDLGQFLILYRSANHRDSFHGKPPLRASRAARTSLFLLPAPFCPWPWPPAGLPADKGNPPAGRGF